MNEMGYLVPLVIPGTYEAPIRDLVRLAVERAKLEGYEQGYEVGKRRAVN